MNYGCPNLQCKNYQRHESIIKNGRFKRKSDSRYVQKFKCISCQKQFSKATFSLEKYQKKRRINLKVLEGLSSGLSMRRIAKNLRVDKKTIKRKVDYLALKCESKNNKFLQKIKVTHMQFDDLITIEHTKLKPLSITVAVDVNNRYILGAEVSKIPAFGHLAQRSRKKYGLRKSEHKKGLRVLFEKIHKSVLKEALITSDEHKFYLYFVKKYFSFAEYKQYKGEKSCIAGQGELKRVKRDPLFCINHTCAMLRANINRLMRRTWCTSKDPNMLKKHLEIFIYYYNHIYLGDVRT